VKKGLVSFCSATKKKTSCFGAKKNNFWKKKENLNKGCKLFCEQSVGRSKINYFFKNFKKNMHEFISIFKLKISQKN
jgi:hypothetical protein